jgi:hypothetical protein
MTHCLPHTLLLPIRPPVHLPLLQQPLLVLLAQEAHPGPQLRGIKAEARHVGSQVALPPGLQLSQHGGKVHQGRLHLLAGDVVGDVVGKGSQGARLPSLLRLLLLLLLAVLVLVVEVHVLGLLYCGIP